MASRATRKHKNSAPPAPTTANKRARRQEADQPAARKATASRARTSRAKKTIDQEQQTDEPQQEMTVSRATLPRQASTPVPDEQQQRTSSPPIYPYEPDIIVQQAQLQTTSSNASTVEGEDYARAPSRNDQTPGIGVSGRYNGNANDATASFIETVNGLLRTIRDATVSENGPRAGQLNYLKDLSEFRGNPLKWTHFEAMYRESTRNYGYSNRENIARLQKAIHGKAAERVGTLLDTATDPEKVMESLEMQFGNSAAIANTISEDIYRLRSLKEGKCNIVEFANGINNAVSAFKSVNLENHLSNINLMRHAMNKLPSGLTTAFYDYAAGVTNEITGLEKLADFLQQKARNAVKSGLLEASTLLTHRDDDRARKPRDVPRRERNNEGRPGRSAHICTMVDRERSTSRERGVNRSGCVFCLREGHVLADCHKFTRESVQCRHALVKQLRVCFRCLKSGHMARECPEKSGCTIYSGSTITVIDKNLAKQIGLQGENVNVSVKGLWSGSTQRKCQRVMFVAEGTRGAQIIEHALTVANLELPLQRIPSEIIRRVQEQEGLDLETYQNAQPKILLGQDNWRLLESSESRRVNGTCLVLSNSPLGWAIHGYLEDDQKKTRSLFAHAIRCTDERPDSDSRLALLKLDTLVRGYFDLDNLGVAAPKGSERGEDRAMKILKETTKRVGNVWETGLLWKSDRLPNLNTRATVMKRLRATDKKLDRDPLFASLYYKEMDRLIENGYATKTKVNAKNPRERYVSHFGVQNVNKPGKVRLVFDAAEKTDGISMNDLLDTGPDLLESLLGVLLRYRQHPFAVKADIQDMYLRVKVIEKDRASQLFLYRGDDRQREPDVYAMTCLIFGSKSSPCSALYVKNCNAERYAETKPVAARSIIKNSYMDDYLVSGGSIEEMQKLVRDVKQINSEANFVLHGWASNDERIVKFVNKDEKLGRETKASLCNVEERVLGLYWDCENDKLSFNVGINKIDDNVLLGNLKPTKREFCSIIMSVYDPLGLLSPFLLCAKAIMQDIWRSGVGWDARIREKEFIAWKQWLTNLVAIKDCSIPRCFISIGTDYFRTQLHVFCDASLQAYAAAAYLRTESHDGKVDVSLVMAKTRVAPVKPTTVPRLELQAAVLGARIASTVSEELDIKISEKIFWSDSTTVLQWIRAGPRLKQTFVRNRLGEIGDKTQISEWRWIPTRANPADDATRPSKEPMRPTDRWFVGPEFLHRASQTWPKEKSLLGTEKQEINALESRQEFVGMATTNIASAPITGQLFGWHGLLIVGSRMQKYAHRWIDHAFGKREQTSLSSPRETMSLQEVRYKAAHFWYREIQSYCFPEEIDALQRGTAVRKGGSLSASSAIMAIQRFACRRGFPRAMYSDNGTNFAKASKELRDAVLGLDNNKLRQYSDTKGFEWHFNPPEAPYMGGAWERQVRSVKIALNHALKDQAPFEEVLITLLAETEHMVNSRPLTHVSVDPRDEEALTPNHFLIGTSSGHLRLERYESEILNPRKTFEIAQQLAQAFWKKWLREYLPTLLPRKKWYSPEPQLKVGDIVLILDYQASRNSWRKGKIIEIYPNASDGMFELLKSERAKAN
ncbi:uncharacterized protein LOC131671274 [Phymastichus coffea]|uniref:uncharacterized protein LOC131671274 n=1 Tax=Phymastichus coffea TaxID=108790 RepID=UPI00273BF419|nr:uncharacterized protein LOC131671274 [Phymastichus coffea]